MQMHGKAAVNGNCDNSLKTELKRDLQSNNEKMHKSRPAESV